MHGTRHEFTGGFPEDLQPLANCGHDVLVYHNGLLDIAARESERRNLTRGARPRKASPFPLERARVQCKSDGW